MSIKFHCLNCKQKLEAENEWIGMKLDCPNCGNQVLVPKPALNCADDESNTVNNPLSCPKCGSEHTQNISIIYESGTSDISSTSLHAGGFASNGKFVPGLGTSIDSGTQQTSLAKRLSPPEKQSVFPVLGCGCLISIVLAFIGSFAIVAMLKMDDGGIPFLIILTILAICVISMAVKNNKFNTEEWPTLHEKWSKQYFCHKCGNIFLPDLLEKKQNIQQIKKTN